MSATTPVNLLSPDGLIKLAGGAFELGILPGLGGSIAAFDWVRGQGRTAILRRAASAPKSVLDAASFPLVPFVNRVRGCCFQFRGREIQLEPNMAGDPSPLHGQGWLSPWQVESHGEADATLVFRHQAGEWPWAYEARQWFRLDAKGLALRLSCRNLSNEPMPCGLGQHPYFPCAPETRIDTHVAHVWTIDENVLPVEKVPAEGRFDLRDRAVCGQDLDHGFGGWDGTAQICQPDGALDIALSSPNAGFFQLYSPADGGLFVAEPVTHANAAMNAPEAKWAELGLRVLEPGEEMALDMRLDVKLTNKREA